MSTNLDRFVQDAIRTESQITDVGTDFLFLKRLIEAQIALGQVLDQIKKNVFYGKPFKEGDESVKTLIKTTEKLLVDMLAGTPMETITVNTIHPRVFHGVIGIATESTELLEAMHTAIYNKGCNLDAVNIGEELGDIDWYKAILCDELGLSWDDTLATVIAKLKARYPDKFDCDRAINRDLETEREILENAVRD